MQKSKSNERVPGSQMSYTASGGDTYPWSLNRNRAQLHRDSEFLLLAVHCSNTFLERKSTSRVRLIWAVHCAPHGTCRLWTTKWPSVTLQCMTWIMWCVQIKNRTSTLAGVAVQRNALICKIVNDFQQGDGCCTQKRRVVASSDLYSILAAKSDLYMACHDCASSSKWQSFINCFCRTCLHWKNWNVDSLNQYNTFIVKFKWQRSLKERMRSE